MNGALVCFPHPEERACAGRYPYVTPQWHRQLLLAWREGYLRAGDPAASEFDLAGPGVGGANWRRAFWFECKQGFRCRRAEQEQQRARQRRQWISGHLARSA